MTAPSAPVGRWHCPECGRACDDLRDGVCAICWYARSEQPKPVRDRAVKLEKLRALGIEPYAYAFEPSEDLATAGARFEREEEEGPRVRVAGRVLSFRDMGKSAFAHLGDGSGRLQIYLRREALSRRDAAVTGLLDLGDWIGVTGPLFRTRTGEVSVRVEQIELLSKTLRPLPLGKEEFTDAGERIVHGGFSNIESRYRQRYADLAANPEVRSVFRTRARIVRALRTYLDDAGYIEVETPILQPLYGGAFARPFVTRHHTLDRQMYLRIADELYLKRLIVGGLERVYEIGKDFRNEGIDRTHNPEFTMLELYRAYADYEAIMELAEEMITQVAAEVLQERTAAYEGRPVNLKRPWKRLSFYEAIQQHAGLEARGATVERLREVAAGLGCAEVQSATRYQLVDLIFSAAVEPHLWDPTIVFDHPIEMSPLAKPKRGDPQLAERFEVIVVGTELVNAFSELNDPIDQWQRLAAQARQRAGGDDEAQTLDEDYVRALEYGLPPTGGLGLGVDRLVMLLTGQTSIRDVMLYPVLREDEDR